MNKALTAGRNVLDFFASARQRETRAYAFQASANYCSHCGGWLAEGESENDCSSATLTRTSAPHPIARAVQG